MDVGRALGPAWNWMVEMLFRPFRLRMWLALGFVSLLAGSGGGGGGNGGGNWGGRTPSGPETPADILEWLVAHWVILAAGFVVILAISLLISWVVAVFNFVFVDDITRKSGAIAEPFARLKGLGTSLFLWQLAFGFGMLFAMMIPVGIGILLMAPLFHHSSLSAGVIAVLVMLGLLLIAILVAAIVVQFFTMHFVVLTMYVRNMRIIAAWKAFWPILKANPGQMVLYLLLRIALALASGIVALFALVVGLVVVAIPGVILGAIVYFVYASGGDAAHVVAIVLGVLFGIPVFAAFIYLMNILLLPVTVFLRAYSMTVLGQADPSLVTIPLGPASAQPPETGPAPA